ncbi:MAG: CooT family nickel-binding protein [Oscillospiraceae bacterium]|jgi:predicted RNA-binding protein|nr:CooT family nickel-binding protein [Oscillospiraceae bacterium]
MCLSSVYEAKDGGETLVCEHVSGLAVDGGSVTLTDIMGEETTVYGTIETVDLINNIIIIAGSGRLSA